MDVFFSAQKKRTHNKPFMSFAFVSSAIAVQKRVAGGGLVSTSSRCSSWSSSSLSSSHRNASPHTHHRRRRRFGRGWHPIDGQILPTAKRSVEQRRRGLFCRAAEKKSENDDATNGDDDAEKPKRISKKEAEEAARAALMGAIGKKKDTLKAFDDGGGGGGFFNFGKGGGGGGDDDGGGSKGTLQVLFLLFCILFVFYGLKPMSAILVNLIYYALKISTATGRRRAGGYVELREWEGKAQTPT